MMLGVKNSASGKFLPKQWSLCPDCWFSAEKIIMSPSFFFFVCFWQKILLGKRIIWIVLSVMSDHHRCCGAWNEACGQMLNTHLPGVVTRVAISGLLFRDITPGAMGKVCGISPFHLLGLPAPAPQLHVCVVGRKSDLGPVSSRCQVVLTGLTSIVSPFFPGQDSGR